MHNTFFKHLCEVSPEKISVVGYVVIKFCKSVTIKCKIADIVTKQKIIGLRVVRIKTIFFRDQEKDE